MAVIATGVTGTSYADTGLVPQTSYTYTVQGVNSAGTGPASAPVTATTLPSTPVFGIKNNAGKLVSTVNGTQIDLVGSAIVSLEESQGQGSRWPGVAAATAANYTAAISHWTGTLSSAAQPYGNVNFVRIPLNSFSWLNLQGISPGTSNFAGNYASAGGSLFQGDPNGVYQGYVKQTVANALAAGLYVLLDLHWGTPTLVSSGQYICPVGQTAMPGPADVLFWQSIANTFGYPNGSLGSPGIMFELFNEPIGSNIFSNQTGQEAALLGSTSQFQFPTSATSPAGTGGGYGMLNNFGSNAFTNILGGGAVCWAVGYQQIINAIRATGATNLVVCGCQDYTGEIETWKQNGGQMVLTDSLNNLGAAFHGYGYSKGFGNFSNLQAHGVPIICTELGTLGNIPSSYTQFRANGMGYTWFSWNNYGSSSNIYNSSMSVTPPWGGNGGIAPNGSN